jgi:hypothetical protein
MEPIPVKLPPGFFRNGTEYESAGRWYDGNLVRWDTGGRLRPIGGWRRVLAGGASLTGKARSILGWRGNNGFRYVAVGTNTKLYIGSGGSYADLTPSAFVTGRPDAIEGPGYGAGTYGREGYGDRRTNNTLILDAATWQFDTWGENLVAVFSADGRMLQWSPTSGGLPTAVTNAPTNCIGVLSTDEGHLIALGPAGNRRKVQWSSQGDNTIWTPADTNSAGSRTLKTAGNIITGRLVGSQPMIWTSVDAHVLDYLQYPLVYGNRKVGERCGIASPNAVVADENSAIWMGNSQFFRYDGSVQPLDCEVSDYVFNDMNKLQRSKIFATTNGQFNEITWFYPSANSIENDRYVTLNRSLKPWRWYFGQLPRTCWLDAGMLQYPVAVDPNGVIWEHEIGYLADGASRSASIYAQSGPAEIGNGAQIIYANLMLPDATGGSAFQVRVKTRGAPGAPEATFGPYPFVGNVEGYVPVRFAGRQVSLKLEQIQDADWSFGKPRFKSGAGGRR